MAILPIVLYPNPILREKCAPVVQVTPEVQKLMRDMAETMYDAPGIGLAAPQVGVSKRIIVVDVTPREERSASHDHWKSLHAYVNPVIVERSGATSGKEGCLSLNDLEVTVQRAEQITVQALDIEGKPVVHRVSGLLAVAIQHEIDHLDGIVILDKASPLKRRIYKSSLQRKGVVFPACSA